MNKLYLSLAIAIPKTQYSLPWSAYTPLLGVQLGCRDCDFSRLFCMSWCLLAEFCVSFMWIRRNVCSWGYPWKCTGYICHLLCLGDKVSHQNSPCELEIWPVNSWDSLLSNRRTASVGAGGSELRSSCFCGENFTNWAISLASTFFLKTGNELSAQIH